MDKYWIITYIWIRDGREISDNELWKGRVAEWILMSIDQPESWKFASAHELTEEDYGDLLGKIG